VPQQIMTGPATTLRYVEERLTRMRAERIWPNGLRYLWTDASDGTYFALFTKCVRGTVSQRSDRAFGGAWLFGARVGIGAESSIGPFRLQYGLSTRGGRQWFACIGRWI